jgi:purine-binding chemotaxis protein CheW
MTPVSQLPTTASAPEISAFDYVTVTVAGQIFGLPIKRVHDVFIANNMTKVPLAPPQIVGLLNLRGRVVTALSLRERLGMPPMDDEGGTTGKMALGIEDNGEALALIVDKIGEVMKLDESTFEANPVHLDPAWAQLSAGIHRLADQILIILDIGSLLDFSFKSVTSKSAA